MSGSLLALTLALALSGPDGPQRPMPEAFQGLWSSDASACDDFESEALMEILDVRLQFYESGADFTAIQVNGERSVRFEGAWWDGNDIDGNDMLIVQNKSAEMTLSPDRSRLTLAIDGEAYTYVKCPGAT